MTGAVRLIRSCFAGVSSNTVIFACLITALILWTAGVRKRLVQPEERKYITYTAVLIILLMAVRTVKFVFLPPGHVLTRYAWYLYYVPQTFTALFIFLAVLHIGKPADMPINRLWSLLYIPAALISAGIVTNDFHGLAFVFPEGLNNWSEGGAYFHGRYTIYQ